MPGDGDGETPMDFALLLVASCFPGTACVAPPLGVVQTAVEALTLSNAAFDFRHVKPTGVLGGVVELQTVQQASGFMRRKGLI